MKKLIHKKRRGGFCCVEYTSKNLTFNIFEPPGSSGEVVIYDDNEHVIFSSFCGSHGDRINEIKRQATELKKQLKILDKSAKIMAKHKYKK